MKTVPISQVGINEMIEAVRSMLTTAISEERNIQFEAFRPTYEIPSSGPIQEYAPTGETIITISIGMKGKAK